MARGYFSDRLSSLSSQERTAVETAARSLPPIEPPVMEHLASVLYRGLGHEDLSWPRMASALAWSLGGAAMFALGIQLLSIPATLTAVIVWTFLPFAIRASRSFQPDPLMTALAVLALAAGLRFFRRPSAYSGALFTCAIAAALAVKAVAVFFLAPALVSLIFFGAAPSRVRIAGALIALVAAVPAALYYTHLRLATDYGPFVQLLRQPDFWWGWQRMLSRVVSIPLLLAAIAGTAFAAPDLRRLLTALFVGYVVFGVVFTHHISTHDYYSLPLVPVVALGVGALVDGVRRFARVWLTPEGAAIGLSSLCMIAGTASVGWMERPAMREALRSEAARYERIGALVNHSTRVLALDGAYGLPLEYYGRVGASTWPLSIDLAMVPFTGKPYDVAAERVSSSGADFFVCTIQPELDAQRDLERLLQQRYRAIGRDGPVGRWTYVVYDLRHEIVSATPATVPLFSHLRETATAKIQVFAPPSARWRVRVADPDLLRIDPDEGTGARALKITSVPSDRETDRTTSLEISSQADTATVEVHVRVIGGVDQPPFGFVDVPPNPVALRPEGVLFQGWALDDTDMRRVLVGYLDARRGFVELGEATREGARPDVAAAFPHAQDLSRAAWHFMLSARQLSNVRLPVEVQFVAEDGVGHRTVIGTRTVSR